MSAVCLTVGPAYIPAGARRRRRSRPALPLPVAMGCCVGRELSKPSNSEMARKELERVKAEAALSVAVANPVLQSEAAAAQKVEEDGAAAMAQAGGVGSTGG